MNVISAKEWLNKAWHHLSAGKILYDAEHFTDSIGIDLHYAIETILKSFLAYENKKIIKTHDLIVLIELIKHQKAFTYDEKKLLVIITNYRIKGAYPPKDRKLPSREEIKEVLDFAEELFDKVCNILKIDKKEVMK